MLHDNSIKIFNRLQQAYKCVRAFVVYANVA